MIHFTNLHNLTKATGNNNFRVKTNAGRLFPHDFESFPVPQGPSREEAHKQQPTIYNEFHKMELVVRINLEEGSSLEYQTEPERSR
ncbi:hypothetical protein ACRQGZ_00600 [Actinotignum sp. GS-2025c]|uniref:hypothetical protein n=1 Tax=Actinotignum TaxID=1653174 RepID=UPI000F7F188E|nr:MULTISPECIES: hypothetical protein [Actinotignum]MDE1535653.1 hypothetical protein [Actinotignum schaalii]MDY5148514.1 hypothetical protein [Actinotignum sanguinis]